MIEGTALKRELYHEHDDHQLIGGLRIYRCDSVFAPVSGQPVLQCVRRLDHPGSHCDEQGRQWGH